MGINPKLSLLPLLIWGTALATANNADAGKSCFLCLRQENICICIKMFFLYFFFDYCTVSESGQVFMHHAHKTTVSSH